MIKRLSVLLALVVVLTLALAACAAGEPGPAGPAGPAGPSGPAGEVTETDLSCTQCHDSSGLISGHQATWSVSKHGSGESFIRGNAAGCAGCHSGATFSARVAEGLDPTSVEEGDPNPTRQDCRTCHQIHTTYTRDDFALETTDPVAMYALEGVTFDGGKGNLCVNCHQPRTAFAAEGGSVEVTSIRYGPHHGPQSSLLLGVGGAGDVEGGPAAHGAMVADTCVTCHLANGNHTFEPQLAACQDCHTDAENFDINGLQTKVEELIAELEAALLAKGMVAAGADGVLMPVPGTYPEAEAGALWNYVYVAHEDRSTGVHNPAYTVALLEASIEALK